MKRYLLIMFFVFTRYSFAVDGESSPQHFNSYKEVFTYIAEHTELPDTSPDTIFQLACESSIDHIPSLSDGVALLVIKTNFYRFVIDGWDNSIRGAQGNGEYYIFEARKGGFNLVGVILGNMYKTEYTTINGVRGGVS